MRITSLKGQPQMKQPIESILDALVQAGLPPEFRNRVYDVHLYWDLCTVKYAIDNPKPAIGELTLELGTRETPQ